MSLTSTPQSPESVEIAEVSTINPTTIHSASPFEMVKTLCRIFAMARLTQPRMMQLMSRPRSRARQPRRNAGGGSGFRYSLSIEDKPADDDIVIESGGVRCFVDSFSAQYLNGVTLDYKSNFQESGFAFDNPNATGGCGCGSSFTV